MLFQKLVDSKNFTRFPYSQLGERLADNDPKH